jgi:hypothetical protein
LSQVVANNLLRFSTGGYKRAGEEHPMIFWRILWFSVFLLMPVVAFAQSGPFDPRTYQGRHVGKPTQILVLGTPHLSATPDGWNPAVLEPLLERLAAFKPDAIAIEALPGHNISTMWQYRASFPDVATTYGGRAMLIAAIARSRVQMDMPEADAEVRRTLAAWPAKPTAEQRRKLAALFAASGDPHSALVQWWQLDPKDRIADANVAPLLVEQLAAYDTRRNENHMIAARLAARLGLQRLYPTDDQSDDAGPNFLEPMQAFMKEPWLKEMLAEPKTKLLVDSAKALTTPEAALQTYRMLNTDATGHVDADGQWLNMLVRPSPEEVGRRRVAAWEVRNLRMAANIREVTARHTGGRLLVIVGSSHKPWFDAYLRMMSDVQVVDAAKVLQ